MTTVERENRRRRTSRRRRITAFFVFLCIVGLIFTSLCLKKAFKVQQEQQKQIQTLQETVVELSKDTSEVLVLKSGPDTLVYGIIEEYVKNITVETTYPIVVYQAIAKDGTVLLNEVNQYTGTAKLHSFEIKDLSSEVGELRFAAFDKEGKQLAARCYYF